MFAQSTGAFGHCAGESPNLVRVFAMRFRKARQAIVAFGTGVRVQGQEVRRIARRTFRVLYARDRYLFSRVSMMIFTPGSMNGGTWTIRPVSILAGL